MAVEIEKKKEIFDKLMLLPGLRIFEPFYAKHKEVLMYLLFGGLAFFLNVGLFVGIYKVFHINELINNFICWVVCVLFQFFTNRTWVFNRHVDTSSEFIKQMTSFLGGRILTLVVEELILWAFIKLLGFNTTIIKLVAQVVVIVLNYVISKVVVFKK